MHKHSWYSALRALIVVAVASGAAACAADAPLGTSVEASRVSGAAAAFRAPDLGSCGDMQVPEGSVLAYRTFATGDQVYRWNGTSWVFVAPAAELFADAGHTAKVGTHYAGPTWESVSGSKVVAAVLDRCTPDANAIPWLKLGSVSTAGAGIFAGTTHILRLNTVGGLAPSVPGSVIGEEARVPYTADYYFYRAN
jgi:hypothetical protein